MTKAQRGERVMRGSKPGGFISGSKAFIDREADAVDVAYEQMRDKEQRRTTADHLRDAEREIHQLKELYGNATIKIKECHGERGAMEDQQTERMLVALETIKDHLFNISEILLVLANRAADKCEK